MVPGSLLSEIRRKQKSSETTERPWQFKKLLPGKGKSNSYTSEIGENFDFSHSKNRE